MFATFRVKSLMTHNPLVLHDYQTLKGAHGLLKLERIRHLPVLSKDTDELVGVLTQRDLYAAMATDGLHLRVGDIMTPDPVTAHPDTPISDAAETMFTKKIGCLPVVEGGRVVGILTESDFVALMASGDLRERLRRAES